MTTYVAPSHIDRERGSKVVFLIIRQCYELTKRTLPYDIWILYLLAARQYSVTFLHGRK